MSESLASAVEAEYDLTPGESALLGQAQRTLNELTRISEALADAPLMVAGSMGQQRPNPLLSEARAHRDLLGKLLQRLDLPAEEEEPVAMSPGAALRRAKAQDAARARWGTR